MCDWKTLNVDFELILKICELINNSGAGWHQKYTYHIGKAQ